MKMEDGTILEMIDLYKNFGDLMAINELSLSIGKGKRHAIIGPNGAGKTTLFNLLSGRFKPTRGQILFNGRDITGMAPYRISRLGIARSFQIINVFPQLSVFENVHTVLMSKNHIRYNFLRNVKRWEKVAQEAVSLLEQIGLLDKKEVPAGFLSYGEQRGLEVGLTIASDPEVILLDEPTAGMSMDETRQAIKLIDRVTKGKTLVIIEHDMEVIFSLADVITVMHYGEIVATGSPEEIRKDQKVKEAYLGDY
ncbi:MAG: ABC transporter ATP-binding protein [Thermodesulfobacteriota bacterium]